MFTEFIFLIYVIDKQRDVICKNLCACVWCGVLCILPPEDV